jgi:hypothetical protein
MLGAMRSAAALVSTALLIALAAPAGASADSLLPPPGKWFAGVTGGTSARSFAKETGAHPAIFQFFGAWGGSTDFMFQGAKRSHSRLMIHITTSDGSREAITPRGIARGKGDGYLLRLNHAIASAGRPVYIRLMAEMDGNWNFYCAYNANGSSRGPAHTTRWFKQAWRRTVVVLRGGPRATLDAKLKKLHLPGVNTRAAQVPEAQVSFLWVPQVEGAPKTRRNSPRAYWPGAKWVNWIGTDFYSKFPNWRGLNRFYGQFKRKPFAFGEWAIWGRDNPGFVRHLFRWSRHHKRVRMLLYNQGKPRPGIFRLKHYPRARQALRQELNSKRIAQYTKEWQL